MNSACASKYHIWVAQNQPSCTGVSGCCEALGQELFPAAAVQPACWRQPLPVLRGGQRARKVCNEPSCNRSTAILSLTLQVQSVSYI